VILDTRTNYWLIDFFHFDRKKPWNDRQKVDFFYISDSLFIVGCSNCIFDGERHKNVYSIIIPNKSFEKTFIDEVLFNEYIELQGIKLGTQYKPGKTYEYWEKNNTLPWVRN
jgi:hypothetical protein